MSKDKLKSVSKAHIRYKTSDGKVVPGATTITGLLNKPYLIRWANQLGLEGIDSSTYTDEAAKTGTLAHAMIQANLQGTDIDRGQFSNVQIDLAETAILSFLEWTKQHRSRCCWTSRPAKRSTRSTSCSSRHTPNYCARPASRSQSAGSSG